MRGFRRRQQGTTLIEIVISILLLSLGLLGLVGLHARTLQSTDDAEYRGSAALAANELTTAMWDSFSHTNNTAVQAAWTAWQSVASRALPSGNYTVGTPNTNGAVVITISWVAPGRQAASQSVTSQYFTTVTIPGS